MPSISSIIRLSPFIRFFCKKLYFSIVESRCCYGNCAVGRIGIGLGTTGEKKDVSGDQGAFPAKVHRIILSPAGSAATDG